MASNKFSAILLSIFAMWWALPVYGQSDRGAITGTVTDISGAVVAVAKVTITNLNTLGFNIDQPRRIQLGARIVF